MEKLKGKKPNIRFPEFKDDWQHTKLIELLSEAKKRNEDLKYGKDEVLSVSGELGIVNQIEHLGSCQVAKADTQAKTWQGVCYSQPRKKSFFLPSLLKNQNTRHVDQQDKDTETQQWFTNANCGKTQIFAR